MKYYKLSHDVGLLSQRRTSRGSPWFLSPDGVWVPRHCHLWGHLSWGHLLLLLLICLFWHHWDLSRMLTSLFSMMN